MREGIAVRTNIVGVAHYYNRDDGAQGVVNAVTAGKSIKASARKLRVYLGRHVTPHRIRCRLDCREIQVTELKDLRDAKERSCAFEARPPCP